MDSADSHADLEVLADEIQLRLVTFESGGHAPEETIYFYGFMELVLDKSVFFAKGRICPGTAMLSLPLHLRERMDASAG
jgi:hypothetical protein